MKTRSDIISITMTPTRPAWITILAAAILFVMTLWSLWMFGAVVALAPLALTLAFGYDLTHHAKSRQVQCGYCGGCIYDLAGQNQLLNDQHSLFKGFSSIIYCYGNTQRTPRRAAPKA
jgi:hypothetical protein